MLELSLNHVNCWSRLFPSHGWFMIIKPRQVHFCINHLYISGRLDAWYPIPIPITTTLCCGEVVTTLRPDRRGWNFLEGWANGRFDTSKMPKNPNILGSILDPWRSYHPFNDEYLPSLLMFFVFFYPWKNSSIPPVTAPFGEKLRTKKAQHSVTTWLVGWVVSGQPVEGWLDDWRVGRNLESSAGTGGEVALQDSVLHTPGGQRWQLRGQSTYSGLMAMAASLPKKTGFKFHPEIWRIFTLFTHHFPGLHKSSRNSICCTESIVW